MQAGNRVDVRQAGGGHQIPGFVGYAALIAHDHGLADSSGVAGQDRSDALPDCLAEGLHLLRQAELRALSNALDIAGGRAVGTDTGEVGVELAVIGSWQDGTGNGRQAEWGQQPIARSEFGRCR